MICCRPGLRAVTRRGSRRRNALSHPEAESQNDSAYPGKQYRFGEVAAIGEPVDEQEMALSQALMPGPWSVIAMVTITLNPGNISPLDGRLQFDEEPPVFERAAETLSAFSSTQCKARCRGLRCRNQGTGRLRDLIVSTTKMGIPCLLPVLDHAEQVDLQIWDLAREV